MHSDGEFSFEVDLTPGETTVVSWKKLLRDHAAEIAAGASSASRPNGVAGGQFPELNAPPASSAGNAAPRPSLEARVPPALGPVGENAWNDSAQPPFNRLNTVIKNIEQLYAKASSDEEDLIDVVPGDDEYDTEDSFIDDSDLNEYFQVDNSATKHKGYFINRGELEKIEPRTLSNEQSKKLKRKELGKGSDGVDNDSNPSKHAKQGEKPRKPAQLVEKNAPGLSTDIALPNAHGEDGRLYKQANSYEISYRKKKHSDSKTREKHSFRVTNGDEVLPGKDSEWKKLGTHLVNSHGSRIKEGSEVSGASKQKLEEKKLYLQTNHEVGNSINNVSAGIDQSTLHEEKASVHERSDAIVADSSSNVNIPHIPEKEGASARARSALLEKAINDLENLVAESRPPSAVTQDANSPSRAIKRRLSQAVKQKLAKVARYAQSCHGKITKEVVDRLMSIVGHLVQLRTLKKNLKIMVNAELSAKQEKDSRVQLEKKEVADMVTARIPLMKSKALEKQAGASDDFQEIGAAEKEALKRKYSMDDILEDKICNLYDLYVDGLEEDVGPQVRELYAELTALWPNGYMDIYGIKRAIRRAKDRKKASSSCQKDPEKMKRKKTLPRKPEAAREETISLAQPVHQQQKCVSEPSDHGKILVNKSASSKSVTGTAARMPVSFISGSNGGHPMHERMKGWL